MPSTSIRSLMAIGRPASRPRSPGGMSCSRFASLRARSEAMQRQQHSPPVHVLDSADGGVHKLQRRHFASREPANRLFRQTTPRVRPWDSPLARPYYSPKAGARNVAGRREDARFVTGGGRYLDDIDIPGRYGRHSCAARMPMRLSGRSKATGVDVFTAADIEDLVGLRPYQPANVQTGEPFDYEPQPLLARGVAVYAGQPVAFVTGATPDEALGRRGPGAVVYGALEPEPEKGLPRLAHRRRRSGRGGVFARSPPGPDRALNHRVVINPMEPRGAAGFFDPADGRYTLTSQARTARQSRSCGDVPRRRAGTCALRRGGCRRGFGVKNFAYPEHVLLLWAARRLGCPGRWTATRSEVFLSDHQSRGQRAEGRTRPGRGRALPRAQRIEHGECRRLARQSRGRRADRAIRSSCRHGLCHSGGRTAYPVGADPHPAGGCDARAGFAEMVNILERLIDKAAAETGMTREELRRRNLVSRLPMTNALGFTVDSGAFSESFALAERHADGFGRAAQAKRGGGPAYAVLASPAISRARAGRPKRMSSCASMRTAGWTSVTGTQHIGQGHETTFPEIVAGCLDLPSACIHLV